MFILYFLFLFYDSLISELPPKSTKFHLCEVHNYKPPTENPSAVCCQIYFIRDNVPCLFSSVLYVKYI